jgi:hypothetical protein
LIFSKEPGNEEGEEGSGEGHMGEVAKTTYTLMNNCITIEIFSIQSEDMFSWTHV